MALAQKQGRALLPAAADEGLTQLANLSGESFDRTFVEMMLADHREALSLVQNALPRVSNREVAALLGKLVPVLELHRDVALTLSEGFRAQAVK